MEYEDRITIWAPEGIALDYTLAGLGSRFIAAAADTIIRLAVIGAIIGVMSALGASRIALLIALIVLSFLALFAYDIAFEVWAGGRTPGKRWSSLRVLMADGQPISFSPSAVRNLMRIVDEYATALIPGTISILVTKRSQRLGDLAAGTIVVREPRGGGGSLGAAVSGGSSAAPHNRQPELDVTAVTAAELAAIRDFLARRDKLTRESRARVAGVLAEGVRAKVGGLTDGALSPEELLEAVAASKGTVI